MEAREPEPIRPRARRPYERPRVERVPLRPEEAVLGFCKNSNAAGPVASPCIFPVACSTAGS